MSPLSGELSSSLRYFLVPLLVLVAVVVVASLYGDGGRLWEGAKPGRAGVSVEVAPAGGEKLAPQGGITARPTTSGTAPSAPSTSAPATSVPATSVPAAAVPYQELAAGECFDVDRRAPGTVVRRACHRPHDAQVVAVVRLTGDHRTDQEVRDAAAALCREPLHRKAAEQPHGTRWTTFVQYPYRTGYLLGSDTVTCSLIPYAQHTAPDGTAGRLTAPLQ
ncbi:hypothetical protein [Streptomyces vilmorinianum]|uniref:hypothetical protein n=1 Tax=Streptomyces vilmorinianum TaxID=3051092 RepID=UPI0010FBB3F2|nr:hypothetical protein [Streptomyces vilmorinianum]